MRNFAQRSGNIDTLTGLRSFLIIWIVLYHLKEELAVLLPWPPLLSFAAAGFAGVDFFFILSGFVIAYSYAPRFKSFNLKNYGKFLWLRLARIYPLHFITLGATILLVVAANASGSELSYPEFYSLSGLIQNLFLVQAWSLPTAFSWNAIAWAVSCEWLAYLLFPVVIAATLRIRNPAYSAAAMIAVLLLTAAICQGLDVNWQAIRGAGSYGVLRIAGEFVAGCLLYNLYAARWGYRWRGLATTTGMVTVAGITVVSTPNILSNQLGSIIGTPDQLDALWLTPLCAIAIYLLAWEKGAIAHLCSTRIAMKGGELSYALYITHFLCLIVLRRALPLERFAEMDLMVKTAALLGYLGVMVVVAIAANHLIEEPSRRWMKGLITPKQPAVAVVSEVVVLSTVEVAAQANALPSHRPHSSPGR
ncbi:MAG: acyltransferase [Phormidesmis sp.]